MDKKSRTQRTIALIVLSFFVYFGFASIGQYMINIRLEEQGKTTAPVTDKGTFYSRSSSRTSSKKCFYLRLKKQPQKFVVYRINRNYDDLMQLVALGDTLTIYYNRDSEKKNTDADVYQIEKGNNILVNKKEYDEKGRKMKKAGLAIGILIMLGALFYYWITGLPAKK